jgi:glucose/arabinose dehydrogenase
MARTNPLRSGSLRFGLLCSIALIASFPVLGATPPFGFVDSLLVDSTSATGASTPTGIAYEPGSEDLWVLEKGDGAGQGQARVRVRSSSTGAVGTALTLTCVDSVGERGLLGIAFDPDYLAPGSDRFVYLYYTRVHDSGSCSTGQTPGRRNRVSRFEESGNQLTNEEVILEGPVLTSATNHNGGTVRFAPDETLFVSMGDNDTDADPNPRSRDLNDLRGKILRINRDGSIPADNPFVGQTGVREEIWAWGLRNPFRFDIDPQTSDVYIADVGEGSFEEIDLGESGADYGYPCFEGFAPFRTCTPPPNGSDTPPIFVYGHGNETPPVSGGSVTGGPVYRASGFSDEYQGRYFFGDYVDGWIRTARLSGNALTDVRDFIMDATGVVDMAISPRGCLAWVSIGGLGVRETCDVLTASDIDGSSRVDGLDLARLARAFGSVCGSGTFDPPADINGDCFIDGEDLSLLATQFGRSLPL